MELVATANLDTVRLDYTELRIDGVTYRMHELPYPAMDFLSFGAGVPVRGSIAFEVPVSALEGPGLDDVRLLFPYTINVQLDDIPEVIVDLRDLDVASSAIIDEPVVLAVD